MIVANKKFSKNRFCIGSALILAVVLTSLLAIVGVMFLMVARVDRMATSAVAQKKELDLAIDTVIAKISGQLIWDVPGVNVPGGFRPEYHDYPGPLDRWLASLEPYESGGNYYWRHISDIYNKFKPQDLWDLQARIIYDYQKATFVNDSNIAALYPADADGDGVSDSAWVKLDSMNSGKGRPIYAAIRVIDNCGMLNINTAYRFYPYDPRRAYIDGSRLAQIHLLGFAKGSSDDPNDLHRLRCGGAEPDLLQFNDECAMRIENPDRTNIFYLPYDIGDELELRNRFVLDAQYNKARVEAALPKTLPYYRGNQYRNRFAPIDTKDDFADWKEMMDPFDPDEDYDFRHLLTTCSTDRIITPDGIKMTAVNAVAVAAGTTAQDIFEALMTGITPSVSPDLAAQLAVNIKDFSDNDLDVTRFISPIGPYYGFEPQPFISEIGFKISDTNPTNSANNHFAVELYNPFDVNIPLGDFRLELRGGGTINLAGTIEANDRFIIINGPAASTDFGITGLLDTKLVLAEYDPRGTDPETYMLRERYDIYLLRTTAVEPNLYLDKQETRDGWFNWDSIKDTQKFYCRPDNNWNVVYQDLVSAGNTLGKDNGLVGARKNYNIPSFAGGLITVGDIARVLTVGPSTNPDETIGEQLATEPPESAVRIDLQQPAFANIFQYLTVIDPAAHNNQPSETRIKGRINVNTAPWFVIAQLPWVNDELACAIVAYRDKELFLNSRGFGVDYNRGGLPRSRSIGMAATSLIRSAVREELGFASVGELFNVTQDVNEPSYGDLFDIRRHGKDKPPTDLSVFPDLTPGDGAANDFEERDVIFSRISNLATVRSDVFTAYILVRIGPDGPQKRVIAILDRSGVSPIDGYPYTTGRVKVRALHPVPDPW